MSVTERPRGKPQFRARFKERYWVKKFKWHLYKRRHGSPQWAARYRFDQVVRSLTPQDVAIDCGANLGEFTQMLALTGCQVYAFEPDPYTFSRLCETVAEFPNVACFNQAVGVGAGKVKLYRRESFEQRPDQASISSSLYADKINVSKHHFVEVEQIDFIEFFRGLNRPVQLLKIDIEGAEVPLLEQLIAEDCLHRVEQLFAETHESMIPTLALRTAKLRDIAKQRYSDRLFLDWA